MVRKIIRKIHLWLGLTTGIIVLWLGFTGCILVFQKEIESITWKSFAKVEKQNKEMLPPSVMKEIALAALPDKHLHGVAYGKANDAVQAIFYATEPEHYFIVFINPYSGEVLKVKNMYRDFFRIVIDGHYYLWLPPHIGQPIVSTATLIFVVMMITGIILWWPRNKAARKQRFRIKFGVRWRRMNYDLHQVLGFYMSWVAIFIALTGLVFGFQWFARAVYWTTSGGKSLVPYHETVTPKPPMASHADTPATDRIWHRMRAEYPHAEMIEVHFPENDSTALEAAINPDRGTYWKTDYRWFNQHTLEEVPVTHLYGLLSQASVADKLARMNYDIHVGAIGGLPTKILAFFASMIAASLPVTGFLIWRGRKKKKTGERTAKEEKMVLEVLH